MHSHNAKDNAMTVNVRHNDPQTPITPQIDLLIGNALRKRNSLKTYLASAISANVTCSHVLSTVTPSRYECSFLTRTVR